MALTVLDAGVVIGVLDGNDPHHETSRAAVAAALTRGDAIAVPASAYAECLVGPARRGRDAMGAVDAFLSDLPADVEPITRYVAFRAAQLRARHGQPLRLPDALVLATARSSRRRRVVTTDAGWPRFESRSTAAQVIRGVMLRLLSIADDPADDDDLRLRKRIGVAAGDPDGLRAALASDPGARPPGELRAGRGARRVQYCQPRRAGEDPAVRSVRGCADRVRHRLGAARACGRWRHHRDEPGARLGVPGAGLRHPGAWSAASGSLVLRVPRQPGRDGSARTAGRGTPSGRGRTPCGSSAGS